MKNFKAKLYYLPILVFPILLFSSAVFGGKALFWGTPALQFIPWHSLAINMLENGQLPLWNTLNGMGAPLAANYQTALFYPPNWIALLVGYLFGTGWLAWTHTLLIMLHLIWAGLGLAYLMRVLGYGKGSQVISGLAFSLSGFFVARAGFFSMVWAGSWLSWIIAMASAITFPGKTSPEQSQKRPLVFLTVCLGMQLLAGHAQLTWYSMLLLAAWVTSGGWISNRWKGVWEAWKQLVPIGVIGAGLAAVQLVLTAQYLLLSSRNSMVDYESALTYSLWPWRLLGFLAPDLFGNPGTGNFWGYGSFWEDALYIGLLPFLLALSTLPGIWRKNSSGTDTTSSRSLCRFLWALTVVSIMLALGKNTPIFPFLFRNIPTFDMFNSPARFLFWAVFSLSILAGMGFERWRKPTGKGLYWLRLGTAGGFAVTLGAFLALIALQDVAITFIRAAAFCGLFLFIAGLLTLTQPSIEKAKKREIWQIVVVLLIGMDLCVMNWPSVPLITQDFYDVPSVSPLVDKNETGRVYLHPSDEYFLKFKRFLQFETYQIDEDWMGLHDILIPDLNIFQGIRSANNFDPLVTQRYRTWMDYVNHHAPDERENWYQLMDVSTVIRRDRMSPSGVKSISVPDSQRFRLYNCATGSQNSEEAWQKLIEQMDSANTSLDDLPLIVEGAVNGNACQANGQYQITVDADQPGYIELELTGTEPGWLMVSESWYPGWQATIQGNKVDVYPGNYLFLAVKVPSGTSRIVLAYRPGIFWIGLGISIFFVMITILFWVHLTKNVTNKG